MTGEWHAGCESYSTFISILYLCEHRRLLRVCAFAQARMSVGCLPMHSRSRAGPYVLVGKTRKIITFCSNNIKPKLVQLKILITRDKPRYLDFELMGAQWLSGRVLDLRQRSRGFEPDRCHCVVVLEQDTFILA